MINMFTNITALQRAKNGILQILLDYGAAAL